MMNALDITGKKAVVTGARQGLGKVFAKTLAVAGADVCLMSRNIPELQKAADEIGTETGAKCFICPIDITDEKSVEKAAQFVRDNMGGLDILINNAAVGRGNTPLQDTSLDEWNQTIATNLTGTFLAMKHFGRIMIEQRSGKIINLTSLAARVVFADACTGAYDCSKAAIGCLTRCMAAEWAQYHINVNSISPGFFMTDINKRYIQENPSFYDYSVKGIPLNRWGNPQEIGSLALFLCSSASDYITGADYEIDGGYTLW